jgi:hypothetical protein
MGTSVRTHTTVNERTTSKNTRAATIDRNIVKIASGVATVANLPVIQRRVP